MFRSRSIQATFHLGVSAPHVPYSSVSLLFFCCPLLPRLQFSMYSPIVRPASRVASDGTLVVSWVWVTTKTVTCQCVSPLLAPALRTARSLYPAGLPTPLQYSVCTSPVPLPLLSSSFPPSVCKPRTVFLPPSFATLCRSIFHLTPCCSPSPLSVCYTL